MTIKNKHIIEHISWSIVDSREDIFTTIYNNNSWGSDESVSGKGSELNITLNILSKLPILLKKYCIKTVVDAPCGDYNWFRKLNYNFDNYYGIDIVKDIIENNQRKYQNKNILFMQGDILTCQIPKVDLIICRDCCIHLTLKEIKQCIQNFKRSGSKYLLTTSYDNCHNNADIITGQFRKINLLCNPFNLKGYIDKIIDDEKEQKYLYLWKLKDIEL